MAELAKTFTITCAGRWEITGAPNWVRLSENYGSGNKTITVTVTVNDSPVSRNCTLTVKSITGEEATVAITQNGYTPAFD